MDTGESREKFKEADRLFREGRYEAALDILRALDQVHANTKNILYPAALCLEKLGRGHEALPICERLIGRFQDPRAVELKARILDARSAGPAPSTALADLGLTGAADLLDLEPARSVPAHAPVEPESDWKRYALIGVGVAALLAILIIPPLMYEAPPEPPPGTVEQAARASMPEGFVQAVGLGLILTLFGASYAGSVAGGYLALFLMNQLPSREVMDNLLSVGFIMILVGLAGFVPVVGFVAGLVIISKVYDLGCGGLLLFVILSSVFSGLFTAVPLMLMLGSLAAVAPA